MPNKLATPIKKPFINIFLLRFFRESTIISKFLINCLFSSSCEEIRAISSKESFKFIEISL